MDQATLVEMQIEDGQRLVNRLVKEGVDVTAAGWAKESESGQWFLYLATPLVREDGATRSAYRRVNALIRDLRQEGFWIEPLEIKTIGPHDPIAKDMVAHRDSRSARTPTRFRGNRLGELAVEEAYIYPPRRVFVFEYRRRGQTSQWDAVNPGHCVPCAPGDLWNDAEVRVEEQGGRVIITVYSEDALQEEDAGPAEQLADQEFKKRFPGHSISPLPDEDGA